MAATAANSASENIWKGNYEGLYQKLQEALRLEDEGNKLAALVVRASAFYSYVSRTHRPLRSLWNFAQAKHNARLAAHHVRFSEDGWKHITHDQCDVIGTILLRRFFWWESEVREALGFFQHGLHLNTAPAHSRALLHMGCAEAFHLLNEDRASIVHLKEALGFQRQVDAEPDRVQANRQFTRVLRRAMVLSSQLPQDYEEGSVYDPNSLYLKADEYATHPQWGSESQVEKLDQALREIGRPVWKRYGARSLDSIE